MGVPEEKTRRRYRLSVHLTNARLGDPCVELAVWDTMNAGEVEVLMKDLGRALGVVEDERLAQEKDVETATWGKPKAVVVSLERPEQSTLDTHLPAHNPFTSTASQTCDVCRDPVPNALMFINVVGDGQGYLTGHEQCVRERNPIQ
jgi:hypothetical protein